MKDGIKSTEFWALPAVIAGIIEAPAVAWQLTLAYVAYVAGRAVVKALGCAQETTEPAA